MLNNPIILVEVDEEFDAFDAEWAAICAKVDAEIAETEAKVEAQRNALSQFLPSLLIDSVAEYAANPPADEDDLFGPEVELPADPVFDAKWAAICAKVDAEIAIVKTRIEAQRSVLSQFLLSDLIDSVVQYNSSDKDLQKAGVKLRVGK